jgi:AcrR family transcriptional regulator
MRITAAEKEATRRRILDAASDLFRSRGYDATTTRDIAQAAEIATGTLFNYFVSKEAVVVGLAEEALEKAQRRDAVVGEALSLEETLFAQVAAELRQLRPLRRFLRPLLETALSPLADGATADVAASWRTAHLEAVAAAARQVGIAELSPVALQLYWTLYIGVLAHWSGDTSPKQESTLALLDQSLAMFVAWLRDNS